MARSPRHPTVTAIRLMAMAMAVMATRLTAMAMEPVTATRPTAMAMGLGTATRLTVIAPVITGVTEPPITPLFDTVSMPLLPVSIIIVIRTNAGRVRALGQPGRSISCRAV